MGACHLPLQGLNHVLRQLLTSNTPWRSSGWRAEMRHLYSQKPGMTDLQIIRYSWKLIFMSPILLSLLIEKNTKILHADNCFSWLAEASRDQQKLSIKNYVLDCMSSPFTKITYILCVPPISLEQFLRPIWAAVSWAVVLILLQIKLNSNSHVVHCFLSRHKQVSKYSHGIV